MKGPAALRVRRAGRGYPLICRELCPKLSARRYFCRLQNWHAGPHSAGPGKWLPGERTVAPHQKKK